MVLQWFRSTDCRDPLSSLVRERLGTSNAGLSGLKLALPASCAVWLTLPRPVLASPAEGAGSGVKPTPDPGQWTVSSEAQCCD